MTRKLLSFEPKEHKASTWLTLAGLSLLPPLILLWKSTLNWANVMGITAWLVVVVIFSRRAYKKWRTDIPDNEATKP